MVHAVQLLTSVSWILLQRVGGIGLQLVWFMLLARAAPLETVGLYSVINTIWILTRALGPLGADVAYIRYVAPLLSQDGGQAKAVGMQRHIIRRCLLIHSVIYAVCGGTALLAGIASPEVILLCVAGAYGYMLCGLFAGQLLAAEKQRQANFPESIMLPGLMIASLGVLLVIGEVALVPVLISQVGVIWLIVGVYQWPVRRAYGRLSASPSAEDKRELRQGARQLLGTLTINHVIIRLPVLLCPILVGVAETALVEAATRIAALLGVVQWCAGYVISPLIPKAHARADNAALQSLLVAGCWIVFVPSLLLFIIMTAFGPTILELMAGEAYRAAYLPLMFIATGFLVNAASGPTTHIYMLTQHESVTLRIGMEEVLLMLCVMLAASQAYGLYGLCASVAVGLTYRNWRLNSRLEPLTGLHPGLWSMRSFALAKKLWKERRIEGGGVSL